MKRINFVIPIIIIGALVVGAVFLYRNYSAIGWNDHGGYHMGTGMMGSWSMGLMMLLVWGLVLVILLPMINRLINSNSNQNSATDGKPDAIELLKQRYARGELNQGEFKTMIHNLKNTT